MKLGLSDAINYAAKVTKLEEYMLEEYPKKKIFSNFVRGPTIKL